MRRDDNNVAKEVMTMKGREETSRKAQTELDGQSAKRYERTPARTIARKEQRSMEKSRHDDRPRKEIISAKVSIIMLYACRLYLLHVAIVYVECDASNDEGDPYSRETRGQPEQNPVQCYRVDDDDVSIWRGIPS